MRFGASRLAAALAKKAESRNLGLKFWPESACLWRGPDAPVVAPARIPGKVGIFHLTLTLRQTATHPEVSPGSHSSDRNDCRALSMETPFLGTLLGSYHVSDRRICTDSAGF